jgi:uncharacterized small protein (DUF1192 family)
MLSVLQALEECRATLRQSGEDDTAELVSVAILDLRMKLNRIGEAELSVLCEEIIRTEAPRQRGTDERPVARRHPLLRVVK